MPGNPFLREIRLDRASVPDFARYPFSIPAVRALETLVFHPRVTFLIGENGSGKSTLIEAIAIRCGFNPEGGSRNLRFAARPSESELHQHLRPVRGWRRERTGFFLRAESLFNVATRAEDLGLQQYGWVELHERSHGEAFLWLIGERFGPDGLYVLDEPEAALSPKRQLAMLTAMHDLVRRGCQFIIATHSPILMAYPYAVIYELGPEGIRRVAFEDTEHYQVTRGFLEHPDRYLRHLLADPED